jgi:lauroyl/myristoyl acyltransferase
MSWEMAEVYGAVTDQILINLAKYFPYYDSNTFPRSSLTYQADMLAQMGQVNKETMAIIRRNLKNADPVLQRSLEQIIIDSVEAVNPELRDAVK